MFENLIKYKIKVLYTVFLTNGVKIMSLSVKKNQKSNGNLKKRHLGPLPLSLPFSLPVL
jgi:hypothetical protein